MAASLDQMIARLGLGSESHVQLPAVLGTISPVSDVPDLPTCSTVDRLEAFAPDGAPTMLPGRTHRLGFIMSLVAESSKSDRFDGRSRRFGLRPTRSFSILPIQVHRLSNPGFRPSLGHEHLPSRTVLPLLSHRPPRYIEQAGSRRCDTISDPSKKHERPHAPT